jgi:hypothetical protein
VRDALKLATKSLKALKNFPLKVANWLRGIVVATTSLADGFADGDPDSEAT